MLIRVLLNDGYYDYVKPQLLDRLIESNQIITFFRPMAPVFAGAFHTAVNQNLALYDEDL